MIFRVEIKDKPGFFDAIGEGVKKDILDLGISSVSSVRFVQVYILEGEIQEKELKKICEELFCDRVAQDYAINPQARENPQGQYVVEVAHNPGVMDPAEDSALKGIRDLGIEGVNSVKTAKKYIINAGISESELKMISEKLLYNKLIQHVVKDPTYKSIFAAPPRYNFKLVKVDLLGASDTQLVNLSRTGQLFLNLEEMRTIRAYFKSLGRNPTDCELETIAQTWSEHCGHKTFRGKIDYREKLLGERSFKTKKIDNLLKSTVMKVTRELNKPWCVSVFKDNSGVIEFDECYDVCFKVETHNHPSALEPFGGANTGVGGVIRDPLGTGMGAKPVLNTDVFCFGLPNYPFSRLPKGTLHPKRIMKGVVSGVRDYGNKMGIPTVNGAVLFHEQFVGNPLVYCGTVGVMPKDKAFKETKEGDLIVVVGGRTGRDGIHGATFSSGELTHESETISSGAVQIGNPIQEKKMVDTILAARDENLYTAITDCGAGGLSSAVGEMGQELGAEVYLEKVPLKYRGLSYTEIWISESQERMVISVPPKNIDRLLEVFNRENVEATVIGRFVRTGRLQLSYEGNPVCDLEMKFLHDGLPKVEKKATFIQVRHKEPVLKPKPRYDRELLKLLSHYDICSKEWVVRQYDHEVQGGSIIKPMVGIVNDGPSDAAVAKPVLDSKKAVALSCGINFRYGFIDPYWMAAGCIDEALRQIISVGGSLERVAILDNFCWGNPDKPDRLGGLVRAAYGCYDAARAFGVPFISGKDSLYNEYAIKGKSLAIPGTILISAIGVMEDASRAVSMYAKKSGDLIYAVGLTRDELGGSHYYDILGVTGNNVPKVSFRQAKKTFEALGSAARAGLVAAVHDCSDGGLAVALAEMAFSGGLGMDIFLSELPYEGGAQVRNDILLFSESHSRFVVEVDKKNQRSFEKAMKGVPFGLLGCVKKEPDFTVFGLNGKPVVAARIQELKKAWQETLNW